MKNRLVLYRFMRNSRNAAMRKSALQNESSSIVNIRGREAAISAFLLVRDLKVQNVENLNNIDNHKRMAFGLEPSEII